jgi:hypothetical protein
MSRPVRAVQERTRFLTSARAFLGCNPMVFAAEGSCRTATGFDMEAFRARVR